jgi:hypothetical protein
MLKGLVLVCSLALAPDARLCDQANAVSVVQVPEDFARPVTCFMHSAAYLAETSLSPGEGEYLRVVCIRTGQS